MKLKIYSFLDTAVKAFTQPFFMINDGAALRAFMDTINTGKDTAISTHPEHFSLYCVGEWDDENGAILSVDPIWLANGETLQTPKELETLEKLTAKFEKLLDRMNESV